MYAVMKKPRMIYMVLQVD